MRLYCSVSFFFGLTVLQFLPLSTIVNAQQDSCTSTLPLNDLTFNSSLLQCVDAWSRRNYILRAPDYGAYIGIGFSTNGLMVGSSAIVGWLPSDGRQGGVKPYFLGGQSPGKVKPDQGDLKVVNGSLKIESVSSRLYMSFQLTAELPRHSLLYALGPTGSIPSSDFRLREHRFVIITTINYTGSQSVVKYSSSHPMVRMPHWGFNMAGWRLTIIIGALVARHMKDWFLDPTDIIEAHIAIQITGFFLGLTGIICGFVLENRIEANNVSTHKGIGITILVMGILQMLAMFARPDKESNYRKYWNWYHHNIGRIMIILALFNIFYGVHLANGDPTWKSAYGSVVAGFAVVTIGLEVRKFMKK